MTIDTFHTYVLHSFDKDGLILLITEAYRCIIKVKQSPLMHLFLIFLSLKETKHTNQTRCIDLCTPVKNMHHFDGFFYYLLKTQYIPANAYSPLVEMKVKSVEIRIYLTQQ